MSIENLKRISNAVASNTGSYAYVVIPATSSFPARNEGFAPAVAPDEWPRPLPYLPMKYFLMCHCANESSVSPFPCDTCLPPIPRRWTRF
jgi:hypothetical protein